MLPHVQVPSDVIYYLLGLTILFSLIAAIGAWRSPRQLTRDEAEDMFAGAHERHTSESQRIRDTLSEAQRANSDKLIALRSEVQELLSGMRSLLETATTELRGTLNHATEQQNESLTRNLGDLSTNVTAALSEAKRSQDAGIEKVEGTLQQVRADVDRATTDVKSSIVELQRQHNEAKAHSAIQLCEALINSLGTLRNTIAAQVADARPAELLTSDEQQPAETDNGGPENAPDGPEDLDSVSPDSQVAAS